MSGFPKLFIPELSTHPMQMAGQSTAQSMASAQARVQTLSGQLAAIERPAGSPETPSFNTVLTTTAQAFSPASLPLVQLEDRQSIQAAITHVSQRHGVDADLVNALVKQESGFQPHVVSKAGAIGLMQLMPATARGMGVDPHDPLQNIEGGVRYLKAQLSRSHGNIPLALAAYNAGPGAVQKHQGVPPYAETQSYVRSILAQYLQAKAQRAEG